MLDKGSNLLNEAMTPGVYDRGARMSCAKGVADVRQQKLRSSADRKRVAGGQSYEVKHIAKSLA